MTEFTVKFKNCQPLHCKINDTKLGKRYFQLLKKQVQIDPNAIFRDQQKYNIEYFKKLIANAKSILNWDWHHLYYDLPTTTELHKDIEQYLKNGYDSIPSEHDQLLHELHFCLHAIESGSTRSSWLQIEWYNNFGFRITNQDFPAKLHLDFGDLRLQNPYVGHHPLYVFEQNDTKDIAQTCKFHDFVKPGINIVVQQTVDKSFDFEAYEQWWSLNAIDFIKLHSFDTILSWTGHPIVGHVTNLNDLEECLKMSVLEFESITI